MNNDGNLQNRLSELVQTCARHHARKLMLLENLKHVSVFEQDIVNDHHNLLCHIMTTAEQKESILYCAEKEAIAQMQAERDAGRLSEQDFQQWTADVKMRVDTVVRHIRKEARENSKKVMKRCRAILQCLHETLMPGDHPLKPSLH